MVALVSPLWRWVVTDLCSASLTILDHLASDRNVTPKLNEPLEMTCTVPSDNSEVNRLHTDDFPFVAEGVRLLYGFRREYDTVEPFGSPPHGYYTIRASGLILQTDDAAHAEDARTRITAKDAWGYLDYIPVYVAPTEGAYLVPRDGYTYPDDMTADEIAIQAFDYAYGFAAFGQYIPPDYSEYVQGPCGPASLFTDFGQSGFYTGTIETCRIPPGFRVDPGTTLGELLRNLCTAGYMDIWFEPIWDPVNRPGYLNQISIFAQDPTDPNSGMGSYNYPARFSWDKAGRTLMGADNLYDGTVRANWIQWFRGIAGPRVDPAVDATSISTYGEYWSMQHVPEESLDNGVVEDLEAEQLYLRKNYRETLTVNPAPERAPEPFVDYDLGDRCPVFLSDNMRQPLPPDATPTDVWMRIYGIPIDIDDNGTETIRELIVGPVGGTPVTAPFKRAGTDDHVGSQKERVRSLEANCCTEDATSFDPLWNGADVFPTGRIHATTTDPGVGDYSVNALGYVTGNYVANARFYIDASTGGISAGAGDYLLTFPATGTQAIYLPEPDYIAYFPTMGSAYCWDSSANDYFPMMLRLSPTYSVLGFPALEAFDPTTGTLWSATFPFAWAANDVMLAGTFTYFLADSLLGPLVY